MADQNDDAQDPIGSELVREDPSFAEIVVQFVDGLDQRLEKMEEAVRAADFQALRAAAHQLKGSGGGYGYPVLTDKAAKLEKDAKNGVMDRCVTTLAELRQLCQRVVVSEAE